MPPTSALDRLEQDAIDIAFPVAGIATRARERSEQTLGDVAKRRHRVLAIMYQFPPSREVGAQSCEQICRYLPSHGWDVTVVTVQERYIPNADHRQHEPFPGTVLRARVLPDPLSMYRWLASRFRTDGQSQEASGPQERTDSLQNVGAFRRCLRTLLGLPDAYIGWIPPAVFSGLGAVRKQGVECLFSSGPWWSNHLVGLILAELTGLPWIAHFRDMWAHGYWVKPVSAQSIQIEKALERRVIKKARAVVCVTEMQTEILRQANPNVPPSKFLTIPNGYDGAEWEALRGEVEKAAPTASDKFTITYAGNLYHGRSPYPLFKALGSLIDCGEIDRDDIQVDLLGCCDMAEGSRVADIAERYGLANCVNSAGFLSRPDALRRVARSDLLLLLVDEQIYSIPSKVYEYLSAGRPILALTSGGAVVDLLNQAGGAWVVDPADIAGIQRALMDAYRGWKSGAAARSPNQDVVVGFDRRILASRFAEVFHTTISDPASTPAGSVAESC